LSYSEILIICGNFDKQAEDIELRDDHIKSLKEKIKELEKDTDEQ